MITMVAEGNDNGEVSITQNSGGDAEDAQIAKLASVRERDMRHPTWGNLLHESS
jgi:hypothetical protein